MEISDEYFNGYSPKEQVYAMKNPNDKFKLINTIILDFLELRKGYASTIPDVVSATGIDRNTVSKHLMYLQSTRQIYKMGGNAYHKNGRIVHYRNMENTRAFNNKLYTFFELEGLDDNHYIYIQEKEVGKLKTVTVKGGIVIEKKDMKQFISELSQFTKDIMEEKK